MKYKNTKTGAVIETASVCYGGDWAEVKETKPETKTKKTTKKAKGK